MRQDWEREENVQWKCNHESPIDNNDTDKMRAGVDAREALPIYNETTKHEKRKGVHEWFIRLEEPPLALTLGSGLASSSSSLASSGFASSLACGGLSSRSRSLSSSRCGTTLAGGGTLSSTLVSGSSCASGSGVASTGSSSGLSVSSNGPLLEGRIVKQLAVRYTQEYVRRHSHQWNRVERQQREQVDG